MKKWFYTYGIFLLGILSSLTTAGQDVNSDSIFLFKGKVVSAKKLEGLYNAHIINTTKSIGTVSFFDGTFEIYASDGDSLKISLIGYKTRHLLITREHSERVRPLTIPLRFQPLSMSPVTIYGKTYEQFKRDFVQLKINPTPINEEALKTIDDELDVLGPDSPTGFSGPIQFLYDRFNEKERMRRKLLRNRRKYGNPENYENFPVYPDNIKQDTLLNDWQ